VDQSNFKESRTQIVLLLTHTKPFRWQWEQELFLIKDRRKLQNGFNIEAFGCHSYLADLEMNHEFVDFMHISMETTREFRGLRIWLPLKLYGIECFTCMLDEKLSLAMWMYEQLKVIPGIETSKPALSLLYFRYNPSLLNKQKETHTVIEQEQVSRDNAPDECGDMHLHELNKKLLMSINLRNRAFLSGTLYKTRYVLRICILNYGTHQKQLQECLEDIKSEIKNIEFPPSDF